ncbi:TPM domain-containing protein [Candidatus Omnitrophota bacterium]
MRRIFLSFLAIFSIAAVVFSQDNYPGTQGYVSDFSGVFSSQDKIKLEGLFLEIEQKTSAEVAVVILDTVKPYDIEGYAVGLFESWGIGKKGKDNGVLLLVAVKDRKLRIEVGYGLEGAIPDALAKQVIAQIIVPSFKQGDYAKGVTSGSLAIAQLVAKEYNVELTGLKDLPSLRLPRKESALGGLFRLLFLFIIIFAFRGGFLWWPLLLGGSLGRRDGYWHGSGFGGSSGGFSGGFGGFGGGFSGGGGASGSW